MGRVGFDPASAPAAHLIRRRDVEAPQAALVRGAQEARRGERRAAGHVRVKGPSQFVRAVRDVEEPRRPLPRARLRVAPLQPVRARVAGKEQVGARAEVMVKDVGIDGGVVGDDGDGEAQRRVGAAGAAGRGVAKCLGGGDCLRARARWAQRRARRKRRPPLPRPGPSGPYSVGSHDGGTIRCSQPRVARGGGGTRGPSRPHPQSPSGEPRATAQRIGRAHTHLDEEVLQRCLRTVRKQQDAEARFARRICDRPGGGEGSTTQR